MILSSGQPALIYPVNQALAAYRKCDEHERVEFAIELNTLWLDLYLGTLPIDVVVEITPDELAHAMAVIRRHQRLVGA